MLVSGSFFHKYDDFLQLCINDHLHKILILILGDKQSKYMGSLFRLYFEMSK